MQVPQWPLRLLLPAPPAQQASARACPHPLGPPQLPGAAGLVATVVALGRTWLLWTSQQGTSWQDRSTGISGSACSTHVSFLRCAALRCAVLCCAAGHDLHDGADDDVHDLCRQFQLHYQQHLIDSCLHSTQTGTGVDPLMLGGSKFHAVPAIALVVEAIRLHYCCVCSADTRQQGRDSR